MEAGRSLDALIAEKVMGLQLEEELGFIYPNGETSFGNSPEYTVQKCENYAKQGLGTKLITRKVDAPPYSTSIEAAWEVVEKLKDIYEKDGHWFSIEHTGSNWDCGWRDGQADRDDPGFHLIVSAPTAPHAICLAALKAIGYKPT